MPTYPLNIPEDKHKRLKKKLFDENKSIKWLLDKAIEDYIS